MQEPPILSLGQEDLLEEEMVGGNGNPLRYSCLKNPIDEKPGGLHFKGLQRDGYN